MTERGGFEALDTCVHCGFCLQACPTFLATGDEADSPRGRIELMRALEAGERPGGAPERRAHPRPSLAVVLFRGCVMEGLFAHVHDATIRTLEVNGYAVREVRGQTCCGALHAHAGLREDARALARTNLAAFGDGDTPVAVNSAGCGAMLKAYADLVGGAAARAFAARVRDATQLLSAQGPRPGAPLDRLVDYDPPCHLLHAQRIAEAPLRVLEAIPVLQLVPTADAALCCGSAGLFTLVEPAMSRAVLAPKLASIRDAGPQIVATGNPGCLMQLGAGLAAAGVAAVPRHPVELLDESYRAAGYYA